MCGHVACLSLKSQLRSSNHLPQPPLHCVERALKTPVKSPIHAMGRGFRGGASFSNDLLALPFSHPSSTPDCFFFHSALGTRQLGTTVAAKCSATAYPAFAAAKTPSYFFLSAPLPLCVFALRFLLIPHPSVLSTFSHLGTPPPPVPPSLSSPTWPTLPVMS